MSLFKKLESFTDRYGLWILLIVGAGIRILSAWRYRFMVNLDAGVLALMTKHITEGDNWPVFFYGQAHMGSLEPTLSAGFAKVLGLSGFTVNLGAAFISFWLLPIVYLWAKDAAGKQAGLMATALCLIGPRGFFHYNGSTRAGYTTTLVFGAFLLMYAVRMISRWKEKREQRALDFLILGLVAGLAWWSSQLSAAAMLSAALLLLITMGLRVITWRLLVGGFGFIMGGLPFWIYNLQHEWATFAFSNTMGEVDVFQGLIWFFRDRFYTLYVPKFLPSIWGTLIVLFVVVTVIAGVLVACKAFKKGQTALWLGLWSIAVFTGVFSLLYAQTRFAVLETPRYFLPMVAPLSVLAGIVLAQLTGKWRQMAWLPVLYLMGIQSHILFDIDRERRDGAAFDQILAFGQDAENLAVDLLYAPNRYRSWNFVLDEQIAFVDVEKDYYRPNAQKAELAEQIAVMDGYGGLEAFLNRTRIQSTSGPAGEHWVSRDFKAPDFMGRAQPALLSAIEVDGVQKDLQPFRENWQGVQIQLNPLPAKTQIVITLEGAPVISGLDVWPDALDVLPPISSLRGRTEQGAWVKLVPETAGSAYFWSGSRLYWGEPFLRFQYRFPPRKLTHLKLSLQSEDAHELMGIQNLVPVVPDDAEALDVLSLLKAQEVTMLFADRDLNNRIYVASEGDISTALNPEMFPEETIDFQTHLPFVAGTGLWVPEAFATEVNERLEQATATFERFDYAGHSLFVSRQDRLLEGLVWNGQTLWLNPAVKGLALWRAGEADTALNYYPYLHVADSNNWKPVTFAGGYILSDFSVQNQRLQAGELLNIDLSWTLPEGSPVSDYAVFAHFKSGEHTFYGDHVFMEAVPEIYLAFPPDDATYDISVPVVIPPDMPAGVYTLELGLYHRKSGKRLKVKAALPVRDDALLLEHLIELNPKEMH